MSIEYRYFSIGIRELYLTYICTYIDIDEKFTSKMCLPTRLHWLIILFRSQESISTLESIVGIGNYYM